MSSLTPEYAAQLLNRIAGRMRDAMIDHPYIGKIIKRDTRTVPVEDLKTAYMWWLHANRANVIWTLPILQTAIRALKKGDEDDRNVWAPRFEEYYRIETAHDEAGAEYGHDAWVINDMKRLGASDKLIESPFPPSEVGYKSFFVDHGEEHPYAALAAKFGLELLGVMVVPMFSSGLKAMGITARELLDSHGGDETGLDLEHIAQAFEHLKDLKDPKKLEQVVWGAYLVCNTYLEHMEWVKPYKIES